MKKRKMNLTRNNQRARKGRCFLCRTSTEVVSLFTSAASMLNPNASWSKSCLESMCRLISIPDKHPCKQFITSGSYCADCIQLIRDIDFTLKSLDNFQQQILGFREDLFTKLGDNYKAIPNPNLINVSPEDIQRSKISEKVFFGFDEVIKITFNKIEKERYKWTRTDFMKGAGAHNSFSIKSTSRQYSCSRKAWKVNKDKVDSITVPTIVESESGRNKILCKVSGFIDGNDDVNPDIEKSGNDPVMPCDEFSEDNDNDPDWAVSGGDVVEMLGDSENISKISSDNKITDKASPLVENCEEVPTTSNKRFKCPEENCDVSLVSENAVHIHIRKVHEGDPKPYHCNRCESKFQYGASLINHKKTHPSQNAHKCLVCNSMYGSKLLLKIHMKNIHNVCKPECSYCGVEFEKEEDQVEHEYLHQNSNTPFKCLTCESIFTNSIYLKRHMNAHDSTNVICDVCGKLFQSEYTLMCHKKHIHDLSFVEFTCKVCGHRCQSKSALEKHSHSHSDEKKYVCEICGDGFKYEGSLKRHNKRHLGIFPHNCKVCGKGFVSGGTLILHEETHSGIFAYECPACNKKFKTRGNLRQHKVYYCPNIERSKGSSSRKRVKKKNNFTFTGAVTDEN